MDRQRRDLQENKDLKGGREKIIFEKREGEVFTIIPEKRRAREVKEDSRGEIFTEC